MIWFDRRAFAHFERLIKQMRHSTPRTMSPFISLHIDVGNMTSSLTPSAFKSHMKTNPL